MPKMNLKQLKAHFLDELFLAFYKKGNFKHYHYTKNEFQRILKVFKEMSLDESFGKCEKIYERNILIIIKDIQKILKNFKFEVVSLKKGSVFYTYKNEKYGIIHKWKVNKILKYSNTYYENKLMFEVQELDYEHLYSNDKKTKFLFTPDELNKYASFNDDYFKILVDKNNKKYFSHFDDLFKNLSK